MHLIAGPLDAQGEVGDAETHRHELRWHRGVAATPTDLLIVRIAHPHTLPSFATQGEYQSQGQAGLPSQIERASWLRTLEDFPPRQGPEQEKMLLPMNCDPSGRLRTERLSRSFLSHRNTKCYGME